MTHQHTSGNMLQSHSERYPRDSIILNPFIERKINALWSTLQETNINLEACDRLLEEYCTKMSERLKRRNSFHAFGQTINHDAKRKSVSLDDIHMDSKHVLEPEVIGILKEVSTSLQRIENVMCVKDSGLVNVESDATKEGGQSQVLVRETLSNINQLPIQESASLLEEVSQAINKIHSLLEAKLETSTGSAKFGFNQEDITIGIRATIKSEIKVTLG